MAATLGQPMARPRPGELALVATSTLRRRFELRQDDAVVGRLVLRGYRSPAWEVLAADGQWRLARGEVLRSTTDVLGVDHVEQVLLDLDDPLSSAGSLTLPDGTRLEERSEDAPAGMTLLVDAEGERVIAVSWPGRRRQLPLTLILHPPTAHLRDLSLLVLLVGVLAIERTRGAIGADGVAGPDGPAPGGDGGGTGGGGS